MDLCDACEGFARAISQSTFIEKNYYQATIEVLHKQQECSFCAWLLSSVFFKDITADTYPTLYSILSEQEECFNADEHYITYWFSNYFHRCSLTIRTPSGKYYCQFCLSAEAGIFRSAAAASGWPLTSKVLLPQGWSKSEHISLVQSWLDRCFDEHNGCTVTITGEAIDDVNGPELPKRVLEIKGTPSVPIIKLLEPLKRRARYAALSHCWGPPEKQPLRTTKDNLSSHLEGISLESLPQTFQDAVELAHGLGVPYLWIDSLCIIQDDDQDWQTEAAEMGTIFENATLVIGAAAAKDSTEGLSDQIRSRQARVSIPYIPEDNELHQSSQEKLLVEERFDCSPYWGTLRSRGWVLQERHLSRRQVYFTRGGLSWKCRNGCIDQFGERIDDQQYEEWHAILDDYSHCSLTYPCDRLIALEGLVQRLKKTRQDNYSFGVWHSAVVHHILWYRLNFGPISDDLSYLPSWSWASRCDAKDFWPHGRILKNDKLTQWHNADEFTITDSGLMKIRKAPVTSCKTASRLDSYRDRPYFRRMKSILSEERKEPLEYIYTTNKNVTIPVGMAALDEEGTYHPSCCISLMCWMTSNWSSHSMPSDSDTESEEGESDQETECLRKSKPIFEHDGDRSVHEGASDDALNLSMNAMKFSHEASRNEPNEEIPYFSNTKEEDEYWHIVLMLEPVAGRDDHYRRVGMGVIPESRWKTADITRQDIHLV